MTREHRTPAVSVILPTYNRGAMLRESVDSVLAQSFTDWELLIIDDGSTDGSVASLPSDPRIRVIATAHSGSPASARNVGFREARGEWIALLDSDDSWLPAKLATQLQALWKSPDGRWSCTGYSFVDETGQPVPQRSGGPYTPVSGWVLESLIAGGGMTVTTTTLMFHRSLIDEVGEFDPAYVPRADLDYMLRAAKRSPIVAVPDVLTVVREHSTRSTRRYSTAALLECNARVFEKASRDGQSSHIRARCRRRIALERATQARVYSRDGQHGDAIRAGIRACRAAPFSPIAWRATAACLVRSVGVRPQHAAVLLGIALLAGCESSEAKAQRLTEEWASACLPISHHLSNPRATKTPTSDEYAACDVATRNRNQFLAGR